MEKTKVTYMDVDSLIPYANNPRLNDNAVDAVAWTSGFAVRTRRAFPPWTRSFLRGKAFTAAGSCSRRMRRVTLRRRRMKLPTRMA